MRKFALLIVLALSVVPAALADNSPSASSPAQRCDAQRTAIGTSAFNQLYRTNASDQNAFGKCVAKLARTDVQNQANAAQSRRPSRTTRTSPPTTAARRSLSSTAPTRTAATRSETASRRRRRRLPRRRTRRRSTPPAPAGQSRRQTRPTSRPSTARTRRSPTPSASASRRRRRRSSFAQRSFTSSRRARRRGGGPHPTSHAKNGKLRKGVVMTGKRWRARLLLGAAGVVAAGVLAATAALAVAVGSAAATTVTVTITKNGYVPNSMTIGQGDTVQFTNSDTVARQVTFNANHRGDGARRTRLRRSLPQAETAPSRTPAAIVLRPEREGQDLQGHDHRHRGSGVAQPDGEAAARDLRRPRRARGCACPPGRQRRTSTCSPSSVAPRRPRRPRRFRRRQPVPTARPCSR